MSTLRVFRSVSPMEQLHLEDTVRLNYAPVFTTFVGVQVPPSLLLLSRALYLPDTLPTSDQLKVTISRLPDAVVRVALQRWNSASNTGLGRRGH